MLNLRRWHLYLSCLFSPLLVYFCLSGAWQTFRFNDIPKDTAPTFSQRLFHELSKPHRDGTLPARDPKVARSAAFNVFALLTGIGIALSALLGMALALQMTKRRRVALGLLAAGTLLPFLLLFLA